MNATHTYSITINFINHTARTFKIFSTDETAATDQAIRIANMYGAVGVFITKI
jgi:hypothetical protein